MDSDLVFKSQDLLNAINTLKTKAGLPIITLQELALVLKRQTYIEETKEENIFRISISDAFKAFILINFPSNSKKEDLLKLLDIYYIEDRTLAIKKQGIYWILTSIDFEFCKELEERISNLKIEGKKLNYDVITKNTILKQIKRKFNAFEYNKETHGLKEATNNKAGEIMSWRKKSENVEPSQPAHKTSNHGLGLDKPKLSVGGASHYNDKKMNVPKSTTNTGNYNRNRFFSELPEKNCTNNISNSHYTNFDQGKYTSNANYHTTITYTDINKSNFVISENNHWAVAEQKSSSINPETSQSNDYCNLILVKKYTIEDLVSFYNKNKGEVTFTTLNQSKDYFKVLCSTIPRDLNILQNPYDKDTKRHRANTMTVNAEVSNALEFNYSSK